MIRGIRGATTVMFNSEQEIYEKTLYLIDEIVLKNKLQCEDIAHILVSVTDDLDQAFPARPIREKVGWMHVPVMCMKEIKVPQGLKRCIRLLVTVNTSKAQHEIVHVYQEEAVTLRPDLTKK